MEKQNSSRGWGSIPTEIHNVRNTPMPQLQDTQAEIPASQPRNHPPETKEDGDEGQSGGEEKVSAGKEENQKSTDAAKKKEDAKQRLREHILQTAARKLKDSDADASKTQGSAAMDEDDL